MSDATLDEGKTRRRAFWSSLKQILAPAQHNKETMQLARIVVDSMSLHDQVIRLRGVQHKKETLEYLEGKICELNCQQTAKNIPRDVLHAAFSFALLEVIQSVMGSIQGQFENNRDSVDLDRTKAVLNAIEHPRKPKYFADWLAFHGLTIEDLRLTGPGHDYLFSVFCRAEELEKTDRDTWEARSLLARAELDLFDDYIWLSNVSMMDSEHSRT